MGLKSLSLKVCLPIALLNALLYFAFREVALKRAQIIDEQLAVEVVGLVRDAARFKIHHIKRHFAPVYIASSNHHALWTLHLEENAWKTQAAFFTDLLALFRFDYRVD